MDKLKNINKFLVKSGSILHDALQIIDNNHMGIVFIENQNEVIGCLTDGDIRRTLIKKDSNTKLSVDECMNQNFTYLEESKFSRENVLKLLDSQIKVIPILNENKQLLNVVSHSTINTHFRKNIVAKAKSPMRLSFSGGGTDLTHYFKDHDGAVLNATINKFSHATLVRLDSPKIKIQSFDLGLSEEFESINDIKYNGKLDLLKAIINVIKPDFGFELYTRSDAPVGSGLGGSAVLLSAIIGAFNLFLENRMDRYEIAELAFQAERIELDLAGGWQDQYATVFGGFNFMEFTNQENLIHPLRIPNNTLYQLEDSLILCYSGVAHQSGDIHKDQKVQMSNSNIQEYAKESKKIADEMKSKLLKNQLDDFGSLLHNTWTIKKQFSSKITNPELDRVYDYALKHGALGGKLLGAGGGGYFLFYVPTLKQESFIQALKKENLKVDNFTFDNEGLRTWKWNKTT